MRRVLAAVLAAAGLLLTGAAPTMAARLQGRHTVSARTSLSTLPTLTTFRLMETGDSTVTGGGSSCDDGDRYALGSWLRDVVKVNATFVGPNLNGCHDPWRANAGWGGQGYAFIAGQMPSLLATYHPDIVLLRVGVNDCGWGRPTADILADADRTVGLAWSAGARVLVDEIVVPNGSVGPDSATASVCAQEYNAQIRDRLAHYGDAVRVAPTGQIATNRWLSGDRHLNDGGYVGLAWINLHYGLAPWISARPIANTDNPFDVWVRP